VIFERPSDWINIFSQTFWLGTQICHAKLLIQNGGDWYLSELVYEGVELYKINPDNGWYVVENAHEVFSFDVPLRFILNVINRATMLKSLGLCWSNWYAVHAVLNGKFPSLNCISFVCYLLFGDVSCDLPTMLRDKLMEALNEN